MPYSMRAQFGISLSTRAVLFDWASMDDIIDAGCTTPVLRFVSPDLKGQLQRCIEEVLPAFRTG